MELNLVSPRTGTQWMHAGIRTFFRRPLTLILTICITSLVLVLLSIPITVLIIQLFDQKLPPTAVEPVTMALLLLLTPALTVGIMATAERIEQGQRPSPLMMLTAFSQGPAKATRILVLAISLLTLSVIVTAISDTIKDFLISHLANPIHNETSKVRQQLQLALLDRALGSIINLLFLPCFAPLWYAPALVHWHNLSLGRSLFFSLTAIKYNFGAHCLYLLSWTLFGTLFDLASIATLTMLTVILHPIFVLLALPFSLCLFYMVGLGQWFAFRDNFKV